MMGDEEQSRVFYDLCALLLSILSPPPYSSPRRTPQFSASGFASLLLGISLSLMLCGSVTFVIGVILMPWVIGFVFILYFISMLSNLSGLGRAILLGSPKDMHGPLMSKLPIL